MLLWFSITVTAAACTIFEIRSITDKQMLNMHINITEYETEEFILFSQNHVFFENSNYFQTLLKNH